MGGLLTRNAGFQEQKFLILVKSDLTVFSFIVYVFGFLRNLCLFEILKDFFKKFYIFTFDILICDPF